MKYRGKFLAAGAFALCLSAQSAEVIVGQAAPLSGLEANQGRAYSAGMQLCFSASNKSGGVNGHTFTLVRKDDGGKPAETLAATRQLLAESRPVVLAGYFGNRNIDGLVASGVLGTEKISLVGYRVSEVRTDTPQVFSVRAGLREEVNKFAEHVSTIGMTRLALVYEDSPNTPALVAALDEAAERNRAKVVARVSSARMGEAIAAVQAANPQAILIVTSASATAAFIEQYRGGGGGAQLFAQSGADIEQLAKRLGEEQMQGVAIMQVTPSPYLIRTRLAKELTDAIAAAKGLEVPVSYTMMEGFIACKVIVEAVRRQGPRVTREGMASALASMSSYDLGGYVIGYKPGSRAGSRLVELSIISSDGKIRQ
ncbi:MAG: ABC transporter substrate-binding protein [Pseudomonadota bacterium]